MILDDLNFVRGAIMEHGFAPEIAHFHIKNTGITAFNGVLALHSNIPLDIEIRPHANELIRAIGACKDKSVTLSYTKERLHIRSGSFKSVVRCMPLKDAPEPHKATPGERVPLNGTLIPIMRRLLPYIGQDATRPWSRGMMFDTDSVFVTNNIILIQHWLQGPTMPVRVNIPKPAIVELVRIREEPIAVAMDKRSMTFYYKSGRWLSTLTYSLDWPDVRKRLDRKAWMQQIPDTFWTTLEHLAPFADEHSRHVYINAFRVGTEANEIDGASIDIQLFKNSNNMLVKFNIDMLLALKPLITNIDLQSYPDDPSLFKDANNYLRGAIVGMR